jgi:hypothetical protein
MLHAAAVGGESPDLHSFSRRQPLGLPGTHQSLYASTLDALNGAQSSGRGLQRSFHMVRIADAHVKGA